MATQPATKKLITLTVTNAGSSDYVTILNTTQKWRIRVKSNASGEILYNAAQEGNTIADSDLIYVYLNGRVKGNGSGTIGGGGLTLNLTGTVDTAGGMVNI